MSQAQGKAPRIAKDLSNPIVAMTTVPYQLNYDRGLGAAGTGTRTAVNFQPVVPFSISDNRNIISRTIPPFIDQKDVVRGTRQSGVATLSKAFSFPYNSHQGRADLWCGARIFVTIGSGLTADQFAADLTGAVPRQNGPWSFGVLPNHLWSVSDTSNGTKISATFSQPFVTYTIGVPGRFQ